MTPEEFTARFLPLGEGLYRIGLSLLESQEVFPIFPMAEQAAISIARKAC